MIARGPHDLGGLPAGAVERTEHDYAPWERRVDALAILLGQKAVCTVDERRKNIEALTPQHYAALSYYERWVISLARTLMQRGVVSSEELGRKMEEICSRNRNS